jgi:hypothetical protein
MKKLAFLAMAMLLAVTSAAAAIKLASSTTPTVATAHPVTISIQEMHRQVDMRSLAVAEIPSP